MDKERSRGPWRPKGISNLFIFPEITSPPFICEINYLRIPVPVLMTCSRVGSERVNFIFHIGSDLFEASIEGSVRAVWFIHDFFRSIYTIPITEPEEMSTGYAVDEDSRRRQGLSLLFLYATFLRALVLSKVSHIKFQEKAE